ncbi:MAG: hypothetical protein ACTSYQ_02595 [Candidatus Odinarchaeia archaeon]
MKVDKARFDEVLKKACSRLRIKEIDAEKICNVVCQHTAQDLIEQFRNYLNSVNSENRIDQEEIKTLLCAMWVLRDLGAIVFSDRACGLAITVQEMFLSNKMSAAKTIMGLSASNIKKVSSEPITIV